MTSKDFWAFVKLCNMDKCWRGVVVFSIQSKAFFLSIHSFSIKSQAAEVYICRWGGVAPGTWQFTAGPTQTNNHPHTDTHTDSHTVGRTCKLQQGRVKLCFYLSVHFFLFLVSWQWRKTKRPLPVRWKTHQSMCNFTNSATVVSLSTFALQQEPTGVQRLMGMKVLMTNVLPVPLFVSKLQLEDEKLHCFCPAEPTGLNQHVHDDMETLLSCWDCKMYTTHV